MSTLIKVSLIISKASYFLVSHLKVTPFFYKALKGSLFAAKS